MEKPEAKEILTRYLAGTCTEEEKALVESWHLSYELDSVEDLEFDKQVKDLDRVWAALQKSEPKLQAVRLWPKIAVAAAILMMSGLGLFFYSQRITEREQAKLASEILPGKNDAVLTLSNGRKIILNDNSSGEIARQSGISITKAADGTIVYNITHQEGAINRTEKLQYNTISTPRGGQYQLNLPDGTKVWLNSASELKFPVLFAVNERRVELHGEAYFEVYKNKNSPFHVKTANQDLGVLGTHFNVNAYADEPVTKTTLLEGSIQLTQPGSLQPVLLSPGIEAALQKGKFKLRPVNTENAVAWKNGKFIFKDDDFRSAMRKISRWYDVEVVYESDVSINIIPGGWISRSNDISGVLQMMEATGDVQFKIEGRRITVTGK